MFIRAAEPVEKPVTIGVDPAGVRIKRLYARPNEMIRVKVPRQKLADVTRPIEVSIAER